ncbi:MAG: nickel-dependent lactate racemase [Candidatus Thermoplasmatota archaeon]
MRVEIGYGGAQQHIEVSAPCEVLSTECVRCSPPSAVLTRALEAPVDRRLEDFIEGTRELLVVVNDATRTNYSALVLDQLYPLLRGIEGLRFLVASGTHPMPVEQDLRRIFGRHLPFASGKLALHEPKGTKALEHVGTTTRGTEVWINRLVTAAPGVLVIGNVVPHYFAGYSGGRKTIVPGTAGYATVEMNHRHAMSRCALPLKLEGNPVHEDLSEALGLLDTDRIYSIQTVKDPGGEIFAAFCGSIEGSFHAAIKDARRLYSAPLKEKWDVVLACATGPKALTLYQAQHALENGKLALKDGGTLIWVAECSQGLGDDTFVGLLREHQDYASILSSVEKDYRLGHHKAVRIRELQEWAELRLVTSIPRDGLDGTGLRTYSDVKAALDDAVTALRKEGKTPKVVVMPNAELCVPVPQPTEQPF